MNPEKMFSFRKLSEVVFIRRVYANSNIIDREFVAIFKRDCLKRPVDSSCHVYFICYKCAE